MPGRTMTFGTVAEYRKRPVASFDVPRSREATDLTDLAATDYLLEAWSLGDPTALDMLVPLVIDELRLIAGKQLAREVDHEWEPDDLVDEFFVRLLRRTSVTWRNLKHFLGAASEVMRQIIIDHARGRNRMKRGGETEHVYIDLDDLPLLSQDRELALAEALEELLRKNTEAAMVVELRFFVGLSLKQIAELQDVSVMTVRRRWTIAKLELFRMLQRPKDTTPQSPRALLPGRPQAVTAPTHPTSLPGLTREGR